MPVGITLVKRLMPETIEQMRSMRRAGKTIDTIHRKFRRQMSKSTVYRICSEIEAPFRARQRECARLTASGLSTRGTAKALGVSIATIRAWRRLDKKKENASEEKAIQGV